MHLFVKKHLSSSLLVETILRSAIGVRKVFTFLGKSKLAIISAIIDLLLFDICLFLSERIYINYSNWKGFESTDYLVIYTIPALVHIAIAALAGVYRRDSLSVLRNLLAVFISFLILTSMTFFFKQFAYSRAVVLISYFLLIISTSFWRVVLKLFFRVGVKIDDISRSRSLVVGTNSHAVKVANKLKLKRTDYRSVAGLIGKYHSDFGKKIDSFEVIGSLENIEKIIKEHDISEVIFSSEDLNYSEMMTVVANCQNEPVEFKISGTELDFIIGKTSVSMLDDIPLIEVQYNISSSSLKFIKRLFDLSLGLFVLFFIYPFIYLISKLSKNKSEFRSFILSVPSVVTGKKSFVGPQKINPGKTIFMGKQGLTGFWKLENNRDVESEKLDFYYAKNQNIWLDIDILGRTINKMRSNKEKSWEKQF
jgi:hypothetical protein